MSIYNEYDYEDIEEGMFDLIGEPINDGRRFARYLACKIHNDLKYEVKRRSLSEREYKQIVYDLSEANKSQAYRFSTEWIATLENMEFKRFLIKSIKNSYSTNFLGILTKDGKEKMANDLFIAFSIEFDDFDYVDLTYR